MWSCFECDEELGSVRVRTRVRHRKEVWLSVMELEVLVVKVRSPDRLASHAVSPCEITALSHETRDDPVEWTASVCQWPAIALRLHRPLNQAHEVVDCVWNRISEETNHDPASVLVADLDVEVDLIRDSINGVSVYRIQFRPPFLALDKKGQEGSNKY